MSDKSDFNMIIGYATHLEELSVEAVGESHGKYALDTAQQLFETANCLRNLAHSLVVEQSRRESASRNQNHDIPF